MIAATDVLAAVRDLHVELPPGTQLPRWAPVRQRGTAPAPVDVDAAVREGVAGLLAAGGGRPGRRIAVAVGSRGIRDVATVVAATVRAVRAGGCEPFVLPAMGSHGSGDAAGQEAVLADLGVTEAGVGAPVLSTMDTVVVGVTSSGLSVLLDVRAAEADGIVVVNRVKPHTDFTGDLGSGLAKMAAVGLGNAAGAALLHASGSAALPRVVREVVDVLRSAGRLLGGVGIVEDHRGRTAQVCVVGADGIGGPAEHLLLQRATASCGHLPFPQLDVLVLDTMGKDVSGTGMDSNVLGRFWVPGVAEPQRLDVTVVTVHALTAGSHGNATGMGLADVVPARLLDGVDLGATYLNAITAGTGGLRRSRLPMVLPTDRDVLHAAVRMCGRRDVAAVRMVRAVSTLDLGTLLVSEPLLAQAAAADPLEVLGDPEPVRFEPDGSLSAWPVL